MARATSVLRNAGWLTTAFLLGRGASLAWQLVLARFLSDRVEVYGQLGVLLALAAIYILLAEFGLNVSAQQEWPKGRLAANELLGSLAVLRLITTGASAVLVIVTVYFSYGKGEMLTASLPIALSVFATGLLQSPIGVHESRQEMRSVALLGMIQTVILIPAQYVALKYWGTLHALCVAVATAAMVTSVYGWLRAVQFWGMPRLPGGERTRHTLRTLTALGFPVMLSSFTFVLYYRIDAILLSKWVSDAAAGMFILATLLYMGLVDLTWSQMGKALFPTLAEVWTSHTNLRDRREPLAVLVKLYLVLSMLVLAGGFGMGLHVLALIFGSVSPWLLSWYPLMILILGFWPIVLYGLGSRLLLLEGKRTWYAVAVVIATAVKLLLAVFLIKPYGAVGAAISNSFSQVVMTGLVLGALGSLGRSIVPWRLFAQYMACVVVLAGVWWATRAWPWYAVLAAELLSACLLMGFGGLVDAVREAGRRGGKLRQRASVAT